jgi:Uma2 family endonuclease
MNATASIVHPEPVKLTISDFELLERAGAFRSYAKTELVEGVVVAMNAQFRAHSWAKNELGYRIRLVLDAGTTGLSAQIEPTVEIPPTNLPGPDIVVTSEPRGDRYMRADSVELIVEISDSTVAFDLREKLAMYAQAKVPEYWVVDLPECKLHQFWNPADSAYLDRAEVDLGQPVTSMTIKGLTVSTVGIA